MNLREFLAKFSDNQEEVLPKAVNCQSVADIMKLAEDHNVHLTEAEADELLDSIHHTVKELSDSELEAVTGGAGLNTATRSCAYAGCDGTMYHMGGGLFICPKCKRHF